MNIPVGIEPFSRMLSRRHLLQVGGLGLLGMGLPGLLRAASAAESPKPSLAL